MIFLVTSKQKQVRLENFIDTLIFIVLERNTFLLNLAILPFVGSLQRIRIGLELATLPAVLANANLSQL